jgi:hypothetical protein
VRFLSASEGHDRAAAFWYLVIRAWTADEVGEFGDAQTGAERGQDEGVVPAADPGAAIGNGQERVAFGIG